MVLVEGTEGFEVGVMRLVHEGVRGMKREIIKVAKYGGNLLSETYLYKSI